MHTAVTDLNPNFASGSLMVFLAEEDILRNGYDQARGPCCDKKKWVKAGDSQPFVPVDALPSNYSLLDDESEDEIFDDDYDDLFGTADETCEASGFDDDLVEEKRADRKIDNNEIEAWLQERYPTYMGLPPKKPATIKVRQVKAVVAVDTDEHDDHIRNFDQFPGIVGARRFVELSNHKNCLIRLLNQDLYGDRESHGKRGKKKTKLIPVFAGIDRNWRTHALEFLMTY